MSWVRASVTLPTLGHTSKRPADGCGLEDADQLAVLNAPVAVGRDLDQGQDDGCDGDETKENHEYEHECAFRR